MKRPELVVPAGNLEKLKTAILFGADAVYAGLKGFSLRGDHAEMNLEEIKEALRYVQKKEKRLYIAVNFFPTEKDLEPLVIDLEQLLALDIHGLIVSDVGVLQWLQQKQTSIPIHLSTQANTLNSLAVQFWQNHGTRRIILAREVSFTDIKIFREKFPDLGIELFVHGSMCISYSGRCMLSQYFTGRDANQGDCAHTCRWEYDIVEKSRPEQRFPVVEEAHGTYIFNSKDLNLLAEVPLLMSVGIDAFKIEGRMKSPYYIAMATKLYREVIDKTLAGEQFDINPYLRQLETVSHRGYTRGFFFGLPTVDDYQHQTGQYLRTYDFVGVVDEYDKKTGHMFIKVRHNIRVGDIIDIIEPGKEKIRSITIEKMWDLYKELLVESAHNGFFVSIPIHEKVKKYSILRRPIRAIVPPRVQEALVQQSKSFAAFVPAVNDSKDVVAEKSVQLARKRYFGIVKKFFVLPKLSIKPRIKYGIFTLLGLLVLVAPFLYFSATHSSKDAVFAGKFQILYPPANAKITEEKVVIQGKIKNISKVYINGNEASVKDNEFFFPFPLIQEGKNTILLSFIDAFNNKKRVWYHIYKEASLK